MFFVFFFFKPTYKAIYIFTPLVDSVKIPVYLKTNVVHVTAKHCTAPFLKVEVI